MVYVKWVAKAIAAVVSVVLAGVVAGELDLDPAWVVTLQAVLAALAVFAVPNGAKPQ